jgi:hypothetical protein
MKGIHRAQSGQQGFLSRLFGFARVVQNGESQAINVLLIGLDKMLDRRRVSRFASLYQPIIHGNHSILVDKTRVKNLHLPNDPVSMAVK